MECGARCGNLPYPAVKPSCDLAAEGERQSYPAAATALRITFSALRAGTIRSV